MVFFKPRDIAIKKLNKFKNDVIPDNNYFQLLPGIKISLDERQCLVINAPKITSTTVVTNDIVKVFNKNQFEWLGRYDNVINSGGVKVFPEQIEQKLSNIIHTRFFVVGVPDEKLGEKLVLIIESSSAPKLSKQDFRNCNLTRFEQPKIVVALPTFVETSSGKINRMQTLKEIKKIN